MTIDETSEQNEDWLRRRTWDLCDADGAPVTTLAAYQRIRGDRTPEASARALLASPKVKVAPTELVAEARALIGES